MSTTLSLILGLLFFFLAIAAVLLQAWLWGPKFWDEEAKKTRAPRSWLRVHAACGYTYGIIYMVMMWNMVPRLWEYQYELPARTVIHAVVAIALGVLIVSKILILICFRHFEESMPRYGFGILLCTVILIGLSVPFSIRAHDLKGSTTDPDNLARVDRVLKDVPLLEFQEDASEEEQHAFMEQVISPRGLSQGREVLVNKCVGCHDMRTILIKPRTAKRWYSVSKRMLEKPNPFGEQIEDEDIAFVTAYLVAITPEIQQSRKQKKASDSKKAERMASMADKGDGDEKKVAAAPEQADTSAAEGSDSADSESKPKTKPAPQPTPKIDDEAGQKLLSTHCTDCHELDEIQNHGKDDLGGWNKVLTTMVEEGAEIDKDISKKLALYLSQKYGKIE